MEHDSLRILYHHLVPKKDTEFRWAIILNWGMKKKPSRRSPGPVWGPVGLTTTMAPHTGRWHESSQSMERLSSSSGKVHWVVWVGEHIRGKKKQQTIET